MIAVTVVDRVAVIRLDKPRALNALCFEMAGALLEALRAAAEDESVGAVLLTGNGRAFCAGSDLGAPVPVAGLSSSERGDLLLSERFNPLVLAMSRLSKPVVVAMNGLAVGGGVGLALSGDIVIAAESASFRLNFGPALGLVPDMGCTWSLPRLVGRARALGVALTGAPISAAQALEWGMVWDVVADAELESTAMALAARLAGGPADAFVAMRGLMDAGLSGELDDALERERAVQTELMAGAYFAEGVRAFKERQRAS